MTRVDSVFVIGVALFKFFSLEGEKVCEFGAEVGHVCLGRHFGATRDFRRPSGQDRERYI